MNAEVFRWWYRRILAADTRDTLSEVIHDLAQVPNRDPSALSDLARIAVRRWSRVIPEEPLPDFERGSRSAGTDEAQDEAEEGVPQDPVQGVVGPE